MNDPLQDAVRALRETTSGVQTGAARFTRARVLAAVRVQKRRRVVRLTLGLPLAAILIGSGAWAASGESLPSLVRRVSVVLGLQAPAKQTANVGQPAPSGRRAVAPELSAVSAATAPLSPPPVADATDPSAALNATGATVALAVNEPGVVPAIPTAKPQASSDRQLPRDNPITELELSLYEAAHRAHFANRDYGAALAGWNEYLRQVPRGRFTLEAKYNRALCLLRLGRVGEARVALAPFASGATGTYRKTEAQALLQQLEQNELR